MLFKIFHVALKIKANHLHLWNIKKLIQQMVKTEIITLEVQTIIPAFLQIYFFVI